LGILRVVEIYGPRLEGRLLLLETDNIALFWLKERPHVVIQGVRHAGETPLGRAPLDLPF
jgi:hypothetical protein